MLLEKQNLPQAVQNHDSFRHKDILLAPYRSKPIGTQKVCNERGKQTILMLINGLRGSMKREVRMFPRPPKSEEVCLKHFGCTLTQGRDSAGMKRLWALTLKTLDRFLL